MELKPGYKQTEVGVIPEDWDCVHIVDVAETSSGATPSRAKQQEYFDGGTIPWVKTLDLNNSSILETDECVTASALQQTSLRLYPSTSVLVAMYGGFNQIGRTGMLTKNATINQALTAIRPDQSRLSSRFLLNYLNFRVEYWKSVASSSRKDPNITGRDVREFPIALPPLKEQEAAGEALQDIEEQILMLDGLIAKKNHIKQASMQELLTGKRRLPGFEGEWEVKRLGDVVQIRKGQLITSDAVLPGDIPVIAGGRQPAYYHAAANRNGRTITISASGASAGFVALYDEPIFASDCSTISEAESYCIDFLFYQLLSKQKTIYKAQTGGAQPHIHAKDLNPLLFSFPTLSEQSAIAAVLSDMDAELAALEARRDKVHELKQGMMQQLLTGKIRLT